MQVPLIDVSPGEMSFVEMGRYLSKPLCEVPIKTSTDYGQLLHTAVVKYQREAEVMQKYLGRPVHVIPNGVSGIKPTARNFAGTRVFGTASRIAPHKRLEDLVEAFADIPARLLIAGKVENGADDYARELQERSTPNIEWVGPQDVRRFLRRLHLFVMIAEPAGCPNASLEALWSGLPLIITDVGGGNEQVVDGLNGWLVPPRDAEAMVAAVTEALELPASTLEVMSKAAQQHALRFSIERMYRSYSSLIS